MRTPLPLTLARGAWSCGLATALASSVAAQNFGPQQVVTNTANLAQSVFATDIDGDGDADLLSASYADDKIAWYENLLLLGTFGPQQVISTAGDYAWSVSAADLDGDGDQDVLSAAWLDDEVAWHRNTDGLGSFGPPQIITDHANGAGSVLAADVDADGDLDVLSAAYLDDEVAWHQNLDGQGTIGAPQVITTMAMGVYSAHAADLDADGDPDVLSASWYDDKIAWYENLGVHGTFGPQQIITTATDGARSVFAADLNGDGRLDVLSASEDDDEIAWYENLGGPGTFGPQQIITTACNYAWSVFAMDLDKDGDQDVLSASYADNKIAWYENLGGQGTFGPQQVITSSALGARSVIAADLDGNGYPDAVSASQGDYTIAWYANLIGPLDCNHNGIPDPQDIASGSSTDCNANLVPDECDLLAATSPDCDGNLVPDECDIAAGTSPDCNGNGIPDGCEPDCNGNLVPDDCDIAAGVWDPCWDCNQNQVLDSEDIASWTSEDCNANGLPDTCDIASGASQDADQNGIPDECTQVPLYAQPVTISISTGGTQFLTLSTPPLPVAMIYLVAGTTSGTHPGIPIMSIVVPLNYDDYTLYTILHANGPILQNTLGMMPAGGHTSARIQFPQGMDPVVLGLVFFHAFVVSHPASLLHAVFASNPAPLKLVP